MASNGYGMVPKVCKQLLLGIWSKIGKNVPYKVHYCFLEKSSPRICTTCGKYTPPPALGPTSTSTSTIRTRQKGPPSEERANASQALNCAFRPARLAAPLHSWLIV
ncbi:uncharacterized protein Dana_GF26249, isoform A [Drosophila ananassae]|uniref:Uncharacterized protein, isoform A n=1 Tax=Drosophila ananassae TaxID=7217 RepID=A0A0N8P0P3_DROAN|nr:uncharacterized protein LOC26513658 isoform X1 [Drosophila ananassae]KPU77684.1 uncharacterized protein Dana_GF26249, isoform A [Drosophila ananassae]